SVVLVTPDDADRLGDAVELADVVHQLRAVTRHAGRITEALRSEDRVGSAVAEAHRGGAPVEVRRRGAQLHQRVRHVGFAGLDPREPRLPAPGRARVVARERTRDGAPEQIRRRRDEATRRELIRDRTDVGVDAVDRGGEHDRGCRRLGGGRHEVAIELATVARADFYAAAGHGFLRQSCCRKAAAGGRMSGLRDGHNGGASKRKWDARFRTSHDRVQSRNKETVWQAAKRRTKWEPLSLSAGASPMNACGLDFGTSNSAIGVVRDGRPLLAPVEGEATLIPSAVFFDYET